MSWLDGFLPEQLSHIAAVALIAISFFTSAVTAAVGIGGGVIMLAIMGNLMPAAAVIPLHGVVQLGSNLGRMSTLTGFIDWPMVGWFSAGSVVGAVLGGHLAVSVPPWLLQVALGSFILYSAWLPIVRLSSSRRSIAFLGSGTAFIAMIVGGVAPFVFVVLKEMFTDRRGLIATQTTMITVQQLLKIGIYGLLGFAFSDWYGLLILMIATGFLGTLVGRRLLDWVSAEQAQPVLKFLLTVMAIRLVYMGATQVL